MREGVGAAHQFCLPAQHERELQRGKDGVTFLFQQFVVFFVRLHEADSKGDQSVARGGVLFQVRSRVVSNRLVQRVPVSANALQQACIGKAVQRFYRARGYRLGGIF